VSKKFDIRKLWADQKHQQAISKEEVLAML